MNKINTQNLKGVTDYYGKEQLIRNKIINTLKQTFENYGYSPLDSSVLYNYDVLAYKYQDGAEILNEIYTLKDQGDRKLGLRYDLTVPFATEDLATDIPVGAPSASVIFNVTVLVVEPRLVPLEL